MYRSSTSAHGRDLFAQQLVDEGVVTRDEVDAMFQGALDNLAGIRRSVTDGTANLGEEVPPPPPRRGVDTGVPEETLLEYHRDIHRIPDGFAITPKLARQWDRRAHVLDSPDGKIDWAHAETLAFASILAEGTPIRLTGQDTERGTFSQRHSGAAWGGRVALYPALHAPACQGIVCGVQQPLSEEAAVGFEYGYSVQAPGRLVLWGRQSVTSPIARR